MFSERGVEITLVMSDNLKKKGNGNLVYQDLVNRGPWLSGDTGGWTLSEIFFLSLCKDYVYTFKFFKDCVWKHKFYFE